MEQIMEPLLDGYREEGYFQSYDGHPMHYEIYRQEEETARVVLSHGFCEFTRKFDEVIFYFFQAGYTVYMMDHRGHGYSYREVENLSKVHITDYEIYVRDFHSFIETIVKKEDSYKPLYLYGHSMGGTIGALYLEEHPEVFRKAVLSSPMMEVEVGKYPVWVTWMVMLFKCYTGPGTGYVPNHYDFDGIPIFEESSCLSKARYDRIFEKRIADAHYQTYGGTFYWTLASLRAVIRLHKNAHKVKIPVLLYQAGSDTVVRNRGQDRFIAKVPGAVKCFAKDSKHEIYNSKTQMRREYYENVFQFLQQ